MIRLRGACLMPTHSLQLVLEDQSLSRGTDSVLKVYQSRNSQALRRWYYCIMVSKHQPYSKDSYGAVEGSSQFLDNFMLIQLLCIYNKLLMFFIC